MKKLFGLSFLTVLLGCVAPAPYAPPVTSRVEVGEKVPETLGGDQGLFVATISGGAVSRTVLQRHWFYRADIQIGNVLYVNAARNGRILLPLKSGSYTLDAVHVWVRTTDNSATLYRINMPFTIVAGRITTIGGLALVPTPEDQTKFYRVYANNIDEMRTYLVTHHPRLSASLRDPQPLIPPGIKFLEKNQLEVVRREVARKIRLFDPAFATQNIVGGDLGTIAQILRDSKGNVAAYDVLDTGTTALMVSCGGTGPQFICSSDEPALYFIRDGRVERKPLPVQAKHVWVYTFAPSGIVLVDEMLNIHASLDDGRTWSKHAWEKRQTALSPFSAVRFSSGRNGFYLYTLVKLDPLVSQVLYSSYSQIAFSPVDVPKLEGWNSLIETPAGLVLGPHQATGGQPSQMYFRASGSAVWQARALPGKDCFHINWVRPGSTSLGTFCDEKFYESHDGAVTWREATGAN